MGTLGLFLQGLLGSWMAWAGGILRVIPFFESLIEPSLRKIPAVDRFLTDRGPKLKTDLKKIALLCLFIGCYRAWVFEHNNAQTAMYGKDGKSEAWSKFNSCEIERLSKSNLVDSLSQDAVHQRTQIDTQQSTVNACVTTLGKMLVPETARIRTKGFTLSSVTQRAQTDQKVVALVSETTRRISGLKSVTLKCNQDFQILESQLGQGIVTVTYIPGFQEGRWEKEIALEFRGANWETGDLLFVLMNGLDLDPDQCSITRVQ
jgi:hypothetical protein